MRAAMIPALFLACGAPQQHRQPAQRVISGRVVDERGAPVAGAELLACALGCDVEMRDAIVNTQALRDTLGPAWGSMHALFSYATSTADGRFELDVPNMPGIDRIDAIATAPGHEVVRWDLNHFSGRLTVGTNHAVDIDAWCGATACTGPIEVLRDGLDLGTHQRLAAGAHTIELRVHRDEAGEMRARVSITVTDAATQHVRVDLAPTGTGQSISGTVRGEYRRGYVEADCGGVARGARIHDDASFELQDVPPPPCKVWATRWPTLKLGRAMEKFGRPRVPDRGVTTIDHLPITGLELETHCPRSLDGVGNPSCDQPY